MIKAWGKVNYRKLTTEREVLTVLLTQARDAKSEFFRSNVKSSRPLLKEIGLGETDVNDKSPSIAQVFEEEDMFSKLIEKLTNTEIEFLNICLLQGRKHREVGKIFNMTVAAVKQKVKRLRKKLRLTYENIKRC